MEFDQRRSSIAIAKDVAFLTLEDKYRGTISQAIGGALVICGLYFTWGTARLSESSSIRQQQSEALAKLGQSDVKGEPQLAARLDGIYTLANMLARLQGDTEAVCEVLMNYVVAEIPRRQSPTTRVSGVVQAMPDVEACLRAIGGYRGKRPQRDRQFSIRKLNLSGWVITRWHLRDFSMNLCELNDSKLDACVWKRVEIMSCEMGECELAGARLGKVSFIDTNGPILGDSLNADNVSFLTCNLRGSEFPGAFFKATRFSNSNFSEANFVGSNLSRTTAGICSFERARFDKAKLSQVTMDECNFHESTFDQATFTDVRVIDCNFAGSTFKAAVFSGFAGVKCSFEGVSFEDADLSGADFRLCTGITIEQIMAAKEAPDRDKLPLGM